MIWKKRSQECIRHLVVDRTEQVLAQHVFIVIFMGKQLMRMQL